MSVITVSRELGSWGSEIAADVARSLGWRFVDREIIYRAARAAGVPELALAELSFEGRRSFVDRLLSALHLEPTVPPLPEASDRERLAQPFGGILAPVLPPVAPTLESYAAMLGDVVRAIADGGHVVIVGRGAQVILAGREDAFHVRVTAPFDVRVRRLHREQGLPVPQVTRQVRESDRARAEYVRRFYHADWRDPLLYDMVINTDRVSRRTAVRLIALGWHETVQRSSAKTGGS
ncbi:MAG: cytidylate kinase-like family protein [Ardenticatenia bacterium]|nr:cytidylate kinase-like family protein [Ardenticatenia bacterium]